MAEMKTLTINGQTYEVVDETARNAIVAHNSEEDAHQDIRNRIEELAENSGGSASFSQGVVLTTSGWTDAGDGRYMQTVGIDGVTSDTPVIVVDVNLTGVDLDADAAVVEAWGPDDGSGPSSQNCYHDENSLTFYYVAIPAVNIPLNVGVV